MTSVRVFKGGHPKETKVVHNDSRVRRYAVIPVGSLARRIGPDLSLHLSTVEVGLTKDQLHRHAGESVVFVLSGSGSVKFVVGKKARSMHLKAGDWVAIPAKARHLQVSSSDKKMMRTAVIYLGSADDPQRAY